MINELKQAKYIKISQSRNEKEYFQYNYDVYEIPYDILLKMTNYPTPENQNYDNRMSQNQLQINTKETNINKQIDKKDNIDKTKDLKHKVLINELVRLGYFKDDDE